MAQFCSRVLKSASYQIYFTVFTLIYEISASSGLSLEFMVSGTLFPSTGMITIPAGSLAGTQIVQAGGGTNTVTTNSGQGTVTVTLPVSGNMVNAGGMVMVRPSDEVPNQAQAFPSLTVTGGGIACSLLMGLAISAY